MRGKLFMMASFTVPFYLPWNCMSMYNLCHGCSYRCDKIFLLFLYDMGVQATLVLVF
jgi:hypothetical protein